MSKFIAYPALNPHNIIKGMTRGMTKSPSDPYFVVLIGNYILNQMGKETVLDEIRLHMATLFHSAIMKYKIDEEIKRRCQESLQ